MKSPEVNAVHMDAYKDAIMAHAVYYPIVEFLSATAIACVIWFGGNDVMRHVVTHGISVTLSLKTWPHWQKVENVATIGMLATFIQYAQRFFRPIQDFSEKYNILQSAMASSERVFKLLDTPTEITSPATTKTPQGPGRIEFNHVWFAYRAVPEDGVGTNARVVTGTPARQSEQSSAGHQTQNLEWVSARRIFHHRARRNRRHRGTHRRRQDHDHLSAHAFLRRAKRLNHNRRCRHQGNGHSRFAPPLRRCSARSISLHGNSGKQHPPGHGMDF